MTQNCSEALRKFEDGEFLLFMLVPHLAGEDGRDARQRAEELLKLLGLSGRARHFPDASSGGQRQRVAIVRALTNDPQLTPGRRAHREPGQRPGT